MIFTGGIGAACENSAYAAALDDSPGSVAPSTCIESKTLAKHDRWRSFADMTVRTATLDVPEVVEFQTDGIADVALHRAMHQGVGRVRLDIEEVPITPGLSTTACSTGWFQLNMVLQLRLPSNGEGLHRWRISIFEETAERVSDNDSYLIDLSVTSTTTLDQRAGFHKDVKFSGVPTDPEATCLLVPGAAPPDTELEPAIPMARDEVTAGSSWLLYANAGRRVYLKIAAPSSTSVRVKIYAKEPGGHAFTGICQSSEIAVGPAPKDYIFGSLLWERHEVAFWRFEIVLARGKADTELTATVFEAHNPLRRPPVSVDEQTKDSLGLLTESYQCRAAKSTPIRRQQKQVSPPEYKRLLPVSLRLTTQGDLDAKDRSTFLRALRVALGLWAVNCLRCNFDTLAVVRVDQELWTRADLSDPWIQVMATAAATPEKTASGQLLTWQLMGYAPTAVAGRELYGVVPAASVYSLPICRQRSLREPQGLRIQQALGCGESGAPLNEVVLTLALRADGKTACGSSPNDIACEADRELLEFNARDYAFCLPGAIEQCLGHGPRHVNLLHVLLHEAGHWLGLGHIEMPNAIMASSLLLSRCLSDDDARGLVESLTEPAAPVIRPAAFRLQPAP